jgi:tRNA acetyltransferase TAN1
MLWTPLLLLQFYEDLVDGKGSDEKPKGIPDKPQNKKIKFEDSDSSDDEDGDQSGGEANNGNGNDVEKGETAPAEQQKEVLDTSVPASDAEEQAGTAEEPREKKQRVEDSTVSEQTEQKEAADEPKESTDEPREPADEPKEPTDKPKDPTSKPKESSERNIDDLIDEDLKEIGDRKKVCLLSGCNPSAME